MDQLKAVETLLRDLTDENARLKQQVICLQRKCADNTHTETSVVATAREPTQQAVSMSDSSVRMHTITASHAIAQVNLPVKRLNGSDPEVVRPRYHAKPLIARARGGQQRQRVSIDKNYRAVVRGKDEREAMEGFECSQCKCFYKATGQHIPHLCDRSSKHKYFKPPPSTPAGFWEPWSINDTKTKSN